MTQNYLLAVILVAFVVQTLGHSYVTNPITRSNQKESNTGCRGPNCLGPCDRSLASTTRAPISIERGATINVEWPRNNHAGGFIRLAWAQTSQSDSHASFDAGVQQIVCHEIGGCHPDSDSDLNGGDSGPADGSSRACSVSISVPTHLANGAWTLQWAWFGGAFALGDYYSCVDYVITGGPSSSQAAAVFIGGDYTYPGQQKCKFFNTDRLHRCTQEPCENPVFTLYQERSGLPFGFGAAATTSKVTSGVTPASTPITTSKVTSGAIIPPVVPVTTRARPLTSGVTAVPTPMTSSKITSGAIIPATTGAIVSSGGNTCAGAHTLSPSQAVISALSMWPNNFQATIQITVSESVLRNWHLQVIYPASMPNAQVTAVYNSGKLQCESASPQHHSLIEPAGSWANNVPQGTVLMVEVQATNVGSFSSAYIMQNLQLKVYSA